MKKPQLNVIQSYIFLAIYAAITLAYRVFYLDPQYSHNPLVSIYIGLIFLLPIYLLYRYKIIKFR